MHALIRALTYHVYLKHDHLWLAELCKRKGCGVIDRPYVCAWVLWEEKKRHTSDRCQNSQQGVVIGGIQRLWRVKGKRTRRRVKKRKKGDIGKGREITWQLEKTAWRFDSLTTSCIGTPSAEFLIFSWFLKFMKTIQNSSFARAGIEHCLIIWLKCCMTNN